MKHMLEPAKKSEEHHPKDLGKKSQMVMNITGQINAVFISVSI